MLPIYNFSTDLVDPYPLDDDALSLTYPYPDIHQRTPRPSTPLSNFPPTNQLVYPSTRRPDPAQESVPDYYRSASQQLFPTPSELLSNISHRDVVEPRPYIPPSQASRQHSPDDAAVPTAPLNNVVNKTESQRKARQRAIAEEIGFTPTDPDTISSHEKKRHYLECLEQYVLYLHEQLRLVHTAPLALERVSTYRGLSSRSIRTLLVHMQNTNKALHEGTLVEEQVFLDLSAQVVAAHTAGLPLRRHSVDIAGVSGNPGYSPALTPFDAISSHPPDEMTASGSPSSADGSSASQDTPADVPTPRFLFPGPEGM